MRLPASYSSLFARLGVAFITVVAILGCAVSASTALAQNLPQLPEGCVSWKTYTKTVYVTQPIKENRTVNETSIETEEIEKYRTVWKTREMERTVTEEKPVTRTRERIERTVVRKPVTTTKYRTKTRVEESYEDVTEMREETYTVRKPVIETTMREEEIVTRRPVTRRRIESRDVTAYVPQTTTQTQLAPATVGVPITAARPRPRWLAPGYYTDPVTGQSVYRRRGLHWVNEPAYAPATVLVPQTTSGTTLVPETFTREVPVEETTYVEQYETRKVPVERERIVEETRTRKVPVTVRVPQRRIIEEEIPYTETTYVDEVIEQTIPVTETVMQTVTKREPYTRMTSEWVPYVETVKVPKTVAKRVQYVSTYRVPYLVQMRVAVDAFDRPVGVAKEVAGSQKLHPNWRSLMTKVEDSETVRAPSRMTTETGYDAGSSVLDRSVSANKRPATFDVPDSAASIMGAVNEEVVGSVNSETLAMRPKQPLGPPPELDFPETNTKTFRDTAKRLQPIQRPAAQQVEEKEPESELARKMRERVNENLRRVGLTVADGPEAADSESSPAGTGKTLVPTAAEVKEPPQFEPTPITVDVDSVPPPRRSARPSFENEVDDTIERDVDVSRPDRSQ